MARIKRVDEGGEAGEEREVERALDSQKQK